MKKNLLNEINEMRRLFGYQRGVVISEQNIIKEGDDFTSGPDIAEPEVIPDTDTGKKTKRPFDPSRRERNPGQMPYEDPDTHPQGKPEIAEPEVTPDTDTGKKTKRPFDPSRRERNPGQMPYEDPDTHPQGDYDDEEDDDDDYDTSALADLVKKYLNNDK
jgi:hypothetical protein